MESLLISGVLTVTVDSYIKEKTQRETARDIFHYLLGFKLPEKIQERLKDIVETTEWYRTNTALHCVVSESAESVLFEIEQEFAIVNATQHTLGFEPIIEFERTEHPLLRRIICFDEPKYGDEAALKPDPKEPKALAYRGKPIAIEAGESVASNMSIEFSTRLRREFFLCILNIQRWGFRLP